MLAVRTKKIFLMVAVLTVTASGAGQISSFAQLNSADTKSGYIARLLINEVPFPGERAYESEIQTKEAMLQILWVLHSRIHLIPEGYTQKQIAGVKSGDIIDVITGTVEKRQCEGFYRNKEEQFVTDRRVEERVNYLLKIANSGSKPGKFSSLLNYAQGLASAYVTDGIAGADRYAHLTHIGPVRVTGHGYSWMTDIDSYHPGGNFVRIPSEFDGSLGGNRFFTLKKEPR
jgi:hypothetical protein